jgi:uncharacterized protein (TIGR03437 family)
MYLTEARNRRGRIRVSRVDTLACAWRKYMLIALLMLCPAGSLPAASTLIGATNFGPAKSSDGAKWSVLPVNVNSGLLSGQPALFALAVDPQTPSTWYAYGVAANSTYGFYRSTDSGQTWTGTAFVAFQPTGHSGSIVIDPVTTSTIYGIGSNVSAKNFIIKSTDSGATWTKVKLPATVGFPAVSFPDGASLTNLTTDPKITGLVYAVAGHYIFKSIDFGATWEVLSTGVDTPEKNNQESGAFPSLIRLDVDPRVSTTLYASSGATFKGSNCKGTPAGGECGLYKSVDNGVTWTPLGLQSPSADSLSIDPVSGAIYAGGVLTGSSGAIFKSTDGGTTFTPLKNGFPLFGPEVRVDPSNPSTVYAFGHLGTSGNFSSVNYRSTDAGATWTTLTITGLCPVNTTCTANQSSATLWDLIILPAPAGPPVISTNGVVNGASFQPTIVPNSWVTILGSGLASKTDDWTNFIINGQFPTSVDGVSVTIGGKAAYIDFISPGQINLLAPDLAFGPLPLTVTTPGGTSATFTVTSSQYGPAFFPWPNGQPVATRQDFSWAVKNGTFAGVTTVAAKPGDVIILWGTGFGPTNPVAPTGVVIPSDKTYSTSTLPTVTINNVPANVIGAALAPGFGGLFQVAIQVPASIPDGDWPIQASIGGVSSPAGVVLSVRQ